MTVPKLNLELVLRSVLRTQYLSLQTMALHLLEAQAQAQAQAMVGLVIAVAQGVADLA
jgi:hypothetical protein